MLEQAPHPVDDDAVLKVALAVADGRPVDWEAASGTLSGGDASASLCVALQQVERILDGHRLLYARSPASGPARASTDTLLTEARRRAETDALDDLQISWGPLVIRDKVGRGSFGDVYRAWDPNLEREVALKLVPATTKTESVSNAFEEGRLLARVRHPNVVAVYGVEQVQGRVGIWMEYIAGPTLADEVARQGPLDPTGAVRVGIDVCHALAAVHDAGLLHRDVKAHNVMRDSDGRIVLGDFGTGRELADTAASDGHLAGTPLYLAPEVLSRRPATALSDQYSVGVLLYFLVTRAHPVPGQTLAEVRDAHTRDEKVPLSQRLPDLPRRFREIVEQATAADPAQRFDSVHDLGQALSRFVGSAETVIPVPEVGARARRSSPFWLATSLVAGLMAAGVLLQIPGDPETDQVEFAPSLLSPSVTRISGTIPMGPMTRDFRYFGCLDPGSFDLALCEFFEDDSRLVRRITNRTASGDGSPYPYRWGAFSPNGLEVAYVAESSDGVLEARIIGIDGAGDRLLRRGFDDELFIWLHSWTQPSEILAHRTQQDGSTELMLVSVRDGNTRPILQTGPEGPGRFGRSTDGRYLLYEPMAEDTNQRDIAVLNLETGQERVLVTHSENAGGATWLPGGTDVLFSGDRLGTTGLWRLEVRDGEPHGEPTLVHELGRAGGFNPIGVASNGSLYYSIVTDPIDVFGAALDADPEIPLVPTPLPTDATGPNRSPAWSSDGRYLAYVSRGGAVQSVAVQDTMTGTERAFRLGRLDVGPKVRWSPDDRALGLLGISQFDYMEHLRVIDPNTGRLIHERSLGSIDELGEIRDFDWLTEDAIVFLRRGRIVVLDLVAGVEQQAYAPERPRVTAMRLSPDRTQVALTTRGDGTISLDVMPATGGTLRRVYETRASGTAPMRGEDWSADGRALFFTRSDTPTVGFNVRKRLWRVEVDGGEPVPLNLSVTGLGDMDVHPDGERIAFTAGVGDRETWVMDNVLVAGSN